MVDWVEQVRMEVRNISHELMPPKFKCTTLDEMLEEYVERHPLRGQVSICFRKQNRGGSWAGIPEQVAYEVYRVMQELLSNIVRHAHATRIEIVLSLEASQLVLSMTDDGDVFLNPVAADGNGNGIGLDTIRERAKALGGLLHVEADESGQTFCLRVPLSDGKA